MSDFSLFLDKIIMGAFDCALAGHQPVNYLSGPIVSGRLSYDKTLTTEEVIAANRATMKRAADSLRVNLGLQVLEPGSLNVPGWGHEEYMALWAEFIRTRAAAVVFMLDWEHSTGAVQEFLIAKEAGKSTYDYGMAPISISRALVLLSDVYEHRVGIGRDTDKLLKATDQLRQFRATRARL